MGRRFTQEDFSKYGNRVMYGRVIMYDRRKGYGFIHTETGHDIFLSSFDLLDKEKKLAVGTTLRFTPEEKNKRYVATKVKIISNCEYNEYFVLPDGTELNKKEIMKLDYVPGAKVVKDNEFLKDEMNERKIPFSNLDHVKFIMKNGQEYKIFAEDSVVSDKYIKVCNLKEYWKKM